jgi:hypothetical protein
MSDLSPEAEDLVRAAKRADRPSEADRERVLHALQGRLGDAAVLGDGRTQPAAGGGGSVIHSTMSRWILAALAGIGGGALFFGLRLEHGPATPSPRALAATSAGVVVVAPVTEAAPLASDAPAPEAALPTEPSAPAGAGRPSHALDGHPAPSAAMRDGLSDEVAILSRAETELHAGRFESALKALDEHERRFPRGALTEERTAARIQALCALGRTAEADAQLARLARSTPHSPHEERARQACRDALGSAR